MDLQWNLQISLSLSYTMNIYCCVTRCLWVTAEESGAPPSGLTNEWATVQLIDFVIIIIIICVTLFSSHPRRGSSSWSVDGSDQSASMQLRCSFICVATGDEAHTHAYHAWFGWRSRTICSEEKMRWSQRSSLYSYWRLGCESAAKLVFISCMTKHKPAEFDRLTRRCFWGTIRRVLLFYQKVLVQFCGHSSFLTGRKRTWAERQGVDM